MPQDARNSPIVLLDIAGFDRLPGTTAKREILTRFQHLITQCATPFVGYADPWKVIPRHGTGDGYYFTMDAFPSPVALRFSLDLKKTLIQDNPAHPDFPLYLRVALTLGDVETVDDQLLSDAFTEAARLIDQPRLRNLLKPPEEPMALVVSAMFMDNWKNHPKRNEEKLRPPNELPWVMEKFPDKHGSKVWTGYLQTSEDTEITLDESHQSIKEIAVFDEVVQRFGERQEPDIAKHVVTALFGKGVALGKLGRTTEEIAVYNEVVQRFSERQELGIVETVATVIFNKGVALSQCNQFIEEIAAYDEVVRRFGERQELGIAEWVAKALLNKGIALIKLDKLTEAIAVYNEVVQRFSERQELGIAEQVAKALFSKGATLALLNKDDDAKAICDEVAQRFGERREQEIIKVVFKSIRLKNSILEKQ